MNGIDIDTAHKRRGPYLGGLRHSLRMWFEANPGEMLTADDIAARFDCTRDQACTAIDALRKEGFILTGFTCWLNPERAR